MFQFVLIVTLFIPRLLFGQWSFGGYFKYSLPQNELRDMAGNGIGVGLNVIHEFDFVKCLGIRADFSFVTYGKKEHVAINETIRAYGFSTTQLEGFSINLGPQLSLGSHELKIILNGLLSTNFFKPTVSFSGRRVSDHSKFEIDEGGPTMGLNLNIEVLQLISERKYLTMGIGLLNSFGFLAPTGQTTRTLSPVVKSINLKSIYFKIGIQFY